MKKILFLSPLPPPFYGSAISSKFCLDILSKSKKYEVRSIKLNYSKEISDMGKINLDKIIGIFKVLKQIQKQLKEFRPDIVYFVPATDSFGLIRDFLFLKQIKRYFKKKILIHLRTRTIKTLLRNFFYKEIFSNQKVIVLGKELVEDISEWVGRDDIYILPNAINNSVSNKELNKILKERKKNKIFNILFLSNMEKTKGWPKLLEACKILKERRISFICNFVGDWQNVEDKEYFYNFIKNNHLEKEVFEYGKKIGKEKDNCLKNADVLVFPTEYRLETFGRVVIEAMMFAIPVIANSIATIPSIIEDKKTGFLLKNNTPEEIAEKIEILFKNPQLREKMGLEGRKKFLNQFETKNYKKKFLGIIKSCSDNST